MSNNTIIREALDDLFFVASLGTEQSKEIVKTTCAFIRETHGKGWWDNTLARFEAMTVEV